VGVGEGSPVSVWKVPRPRFALAAAVAGDVGTLPHVAYGFSLSGSVLVGRFRGEVQGAYWPNQTAHGPSGDPANEGGNIELLEGGIRGCFPTLEEGKRLPRFELSPCGGFEAGALRGEGVDLHPDTSVAGLWLAVTLDGRTVMRLSRALGIGMDVGMAIPLRRDSFTLGNSRTAPVVHQASFIEGRAWIGPELRF
jgi:hypothetical protein